SSDQGSDWLSKVERVDLAQGEFAILECVEQFGICAAARSERFHPKRRTPASTQMSKQQCREHCFSDASVRAGDENDFGRRGPNIRCWKRLVYQVRTMISTGSNRVSGRATEQQMLPQIPLRRSTREANPKKWGSASVPDPGL